jgi:hypothetical protein
MSSIFNKTEKPWSVNQFEEFRPHMCSFVKSQVVPLLNQHELKRLLIHGQVKVGKREIVEYITVRDSGDQLRIHVFISSFHRKADASQRDELELHGITVFSIHSHRKKTAAIQFIGEQLDSNPNMHVVIHWDECDYGTGHRQNLADVFKMFRDHNRVFNILYSATPEEMLYSSEITVNRDTENSFISDFYEEGTVVKYIPPHGYCGAERFLNENLVQQATPFFEATSSGISLSEQAKTILSDAKAEMRRVNKIRRNLIGMIEDAEDDGDSETAKILKYKLSQISVRNIISLRLSYFLGDDDDEDDECSETASITGSETTKGKAIYTFLTKSQFVDELKDVIIIADKQDVKELEALPNVTTEIVQWSQKKWWDKQKDDKLILIVNDQTSTRSTEWVCHDRMFATHDYRKRLTFNTVLQAQLRPAHYEQNYGGFQPIRIYGDVKTFRFAIGQINAADYLNSVWHIRKVPKSDPPLYRIKHDNDTRAEKMAMPAVSISIGGNIVTYEGIPNNNGYTSEVAQKILVQLGGTNNGNSKMSQRVRGNSKQTPNIHANFYPCQPEDVSTVLGLIKGDLTPVRGILEVPVDETDPNGPKVKREGDFPVSQYLARHEFSEPNFERRDDSSGLCMGYLRGFKVLQYDRLQTEKWGIRVGYETIRLTLCYNQGVLGLCLRFATGKMKEVNDLESYKSMYQGRE